MFKPFLIWVRRFLIWVCAVLFAEVLVFGSVWVWWSTHPDDPLGTSEVPNSMMWRYFDQYEKQGEQIEDLHDEISKLKRLILNLELRQKA